MANTYTLLETITVGAAGASSVTFNSIPQTGYTDLVVKMSVRATPSGVSSNLYASFNGLTTSFNVRYLEGSGTAVSSGTPGQRTIGSYNAAGSTANTFASSELYIPNYTSANYKSYSVDAVSENNATAAYADFWAGLWQNTAAITSITIGLDTSGTISQYSTFSLYGVSALGVTPTKAPKATGGSIIQTDGTYWYHAFLSSGTFTPAANLSCDVLVVAGGGGGGQNGAGGGGAGGVLAFTSQSVGISAQTITVGAGGSVASSGSNSQFASLTASVGGGGGTGSNGLSGGSGGGGGRSPSGTGGTATSGQGNAGGGGYQNTYGAGGGGGGAGAAGVTATTGTSTVTGNGGNGGAGLNTWSSWLSTTGLGVSGYIAGGGGGGGNATGGSGGSGGGGNGGTGSGVGAANGVANTGSGGGGAGNAGSGGSGTTGGSGLVIIRYLAA